MINPEQRDALIRLRLEQAHETYSAAQMLFEREHLRSALNRLYYSMFYAVLALALRSGI